MGTGLLFPPYASEVIEEQKKMQAIGGADGGPNISAQTRDGLSMYTDVLL